MWQQSSLFLPLFQVHMDVHQLTNTHRGLKVEHSKSELSMELQAF